VISDRAVPGSNWLTCAPNKHTRHVMSAEDSPGASLEDSLDAWFEREVLSHDRPLTRYLARLCPDRDELSDLRQETYARVYEAAQRAKPRAPRAFVFATARNLAVDRARRARTVAIFTCGGPEAFVQLVDEISPERSVSADGELRELSDALNRLTAKTREVLWLRRVQEYSQKEVAKRLGVSEKTVEKHLSIGVHKLAALRGE
jgi:RNA polymerase sigma factor (sigma-70 family)